MAEGTIYIATKAAMTHSANDRIGERWCEAWYLLIRQFGDVH